MGSAGSFINVFQTIDQNVGNIETQRLAEAAEARDAQANIEIARYARVDAIARGAQAAGFARMEGTRVVARQRIAFAAGGIDVTVGTPADVATSTAMMAELDAQTLQNNAAREAWGFKRTEEKIVRQRRMAETTRRLDIGKALAGGPGVSILGGFGVRPWESNWKPK